jgi:hypothetical protein
MTRKKNILHMREEEQNGLTVTLEYFEEPLLPPRRLVNAVYFDLLLSPEGNPTNGQTTGLTMPEINSGSGRKSFCDDPRKLFILKTKLN